MSASDLFATRIAKFFLDNTNDAVLGLDSEGAIRTWNTAAETIYGYSSAEIAGRHVSSLLGASASETDRDLLEKKLSSTDSTFGWDTTQVRKDGSVVHALLDIYPLFANDSAPRGHCIVAKETTRYKMLQSQLRQTQKLEEVGRLSGGIAHDFNNLLTIITGFNDMIMAELSPDNPILAYSVEVDKAAERAAMLTNQLLSFSRREVTQPRVLNLNETITDLDKMLRRIIGKEVVFNLSLATVLDNVKADPGQISQLLTNLVVNARDAMPRGGVITIATSNIEIGSPAIERENELAQGQYAKLTISDTGTGMDEETRRHLFEPFFTTKPAGKGTGLGLSIVSGIVSQLRGDIRVTTELGKGTTFTILIPVTLEKETEKRARVDVVRGGPKPDTTILLVEDDGDLRHVIRYMLLKIGYTVYETSSAHEAIRICDTVPVDLLLTDMTMLDMNGLDLAACVLKVHKELRVLYMTGYVDAAMAHTSFLDPGFHFIRKPFTAARLREQIEATLNFGSGGLTGPASAASSGAGAG